MNTKWISLLAAAAMLFSLFLGLGLFSAAQESGEPLPLMGDVNGNGEIDIGDVRLILQHLVGKITLTETQQDIARVNGVELFINDARMIMQYLVGKISEFPVSEYPPPPRPTTAAPTTPTTGPTFPIDPEADPPSGAAKIPNPSYKRPQAGIPQFLASQKTPIMDGNYSLAEWGPNTKLFSFNQQMISNGGGHCWVNRGPEADTLREPVPVNGDFHMAWDRDTLYMALIMKGVYHFQQQDNPGDIWKEDCLVIQVGADNNGQAERFEFGFTYSQLYGRPLGFRWYPAQNTIQAPDKESDRLFYTSRNNNTLETIYEIRLKRTVFGRRTDFAPGNVIPFSVALHVYDPSDPGDIKGCWYEWGGGILGEKSLEYAALITLLPQPVVYY
ncbi:MAG: hypothetical protein FWE80_01330 [Oscillospiraceae bacterium]|nr:hypothetical protein [Oscillospiraceae bacterium]